jgi:predicted phosphodiesterase
MFNGAEIDKYMFNGQEISKVMFNGVNIRKYRFINLLASYGNFATDTNADGWANGWRSTYTTSVRSVSGNVQSFTPEAQYGNMCLGSAERTTLRSALVAGDIIHIYAMIKTTDNTAQIDVTNASPTASNAHSGSGTFEFVSLLTTVTTAATFDMFVQTFKTSGWAGIEVKLFHYCKVNGMPFTKTQLDNIAKSRLAESGYLSDSYLQTIKVPTGTLANVASYGLNTEISANAAVTTGRGGIAMLDSSVFPQNGVLAYIDRSDGDKIVLEKYVKGIVTGLISSSITYVEGQNIKISKSGAIFKLYYNSVQIGTDQTVKDLSILYSATCGSFTTGTGTLSSFAVTPLASIGYLTKFAWWSDPHTQHAIWLPNELKSTFSAINIVSDAEFGLSTGDNEDSGYSDTPELRESQYQEYIAATNLFTRPKYFFKGNHDRDEDRILSHGVVEVNGVRIIFFNADYVDATHGGSVSAAELTWLETQLQVPATHKILACHFAIAAALNWSIGTGHDEIIVLATANGAKLYLSGHTHTPNLPTAVDGVLTNVAGAALMELNPSGQFMVCEVYADKISIDLYYAHDPFTYVKNIEVALV